MKIDHDTLSRSYREYAASQRPPDRKKCPSPAALARSFEPSYSNRKKKRIIDHISACAFCHDEFMMFMELKRSETTEDRTKDRLAIEDRHSGRKALRTLGRSPRWQFACVLLGICLALSSYLILVNQGDFSGSRRTQESGIVLLSPKVDQSISASIPFRWRTDSDAEYYVVELFDEQLLPVWSSDIVRDPKILLPREATSRLFAGRYYYWMVTGFAQESKIGESPLARFRIDR